MVVKKEVKSGKRNKESREDRDRGKKVEDGKINSGELRKIREELRGIREGIVDLVGLWRSWIEKEERQGKAGEKREQKESRGEEETEGQEEQGSTEEKVGSRDFKRRGSGDKQWDSKERREEERRRKVTEGEGEVKEKEIKGERREEEAKSKERKTNGREGLRVRVEKDKERREEMNEVTEEMMEEWWREVEAEEERLWKREAEGEERRREEEEERGMTLKKWQKDIVKEKRESDWKEIQRKKNGQKVTEEGRSRNEGREEPEQVKRGDWEKRTDRRKEMEERTRSRLEERKRVTQKERRRAAGEEEDKRRREKNVVWRGVEGEDGEERRFFVEGIMERVLGRRVTIDRVEERKGEGGRWVLITEIVREADREEILARGGEVKGTWGVGVDEDLSMEERRMRWRIVEAARRKRAKGKNVVVANRGLWVDERRWSWDEEGGRWREEGREGEKRK
ncbi:trichohyalin-like [Monomorium pharaonis]|uniref:trichohyalin-like n=1 Tax=Monomorium pharaonis TaxID=307658 RepID=UPI001746F853|nr:trichohyalin-like [Monomorium pharaonis]